MVAPVLQAYGAHTLPLQEKYIQELERQRANLEIVYRVETDNGPTIAPPFTRTPVIFNYILQHFELKTLIDSQTLLLKPRAQPRSDMRSSQLEFTAKGAGQKKLELTLAQPAGCSLMALTLNLAYPPTSLAGRPTSLNARLYSRDTILQNTGVVAIEAGKDFKTYISLVSRDSFPQLFNAGPVPLIKRNRLELEANDFGLFQIGPSSVQVKNLECITFDSSTVSRQDLKFDLSNSLLWQPHNLKPAPARRDVWQVSQDPIFIYKGPLNLCLVDYKSLYIKMSAGKGVSGRYFQVYYQLDGQSQAAGSPQLITRSLEQDEDLHEYQIDLSLLKLKPQSRLTGLRLDPVEGGTGDASSQIQITEFGLIRNSEAVAGCGGT